ncbi:hypothetical protein DL762_006344 [Monosporascus cannonballus]|uniref:Uncharacterized protein n=1 Tax=Monosporascus cannonballus TaxID=155416 RepID=A0ABY0H2A9_9PEZI|nr:hypothetical protein DL762_006344 [Monosporascus cannonballus]
MSSTPGSPSPGHPEQPSPGTQSMPPQQPLTATDWRRVTSEVKSKYLSRKYRACWTRCCVLLGSLERAERQDLSPEPVYRIYLHFYAASSFDMGARALPASAPSCAQLLRDARVHYDRAAALIEAAEKVQKRRSVSASAPAPSNPHPNRNSNSHSNSNFDPNASSFLHSPTFSSSGSSRDSTASTASEAASSPRTSLCSSLEGEESSAPKPAESQQRNQQSEAAPPVKPTKRTKKVSFSGLPELPGIDIQKANALWRPADPYVRPDSPTLGWENHVSIVPSREPVLDSPTLPGLGPWALPDLDSPTLPDFGAMVSATPTRSRSLVQRQRENQQPRAPTQSRTTDLPPLSSSSSSSSSSSTTITPSPATTTTPTLTPITPAAATNDEPMAADANVHNDNDNPSAGHHFDLDAFLQARSQSRVCTQLSALQSQIRRHREAVDELLDVSDEASEAPCLPAAVVTAPVTAVPATIPRKNSIELGESAAAVAMPETSRSGVETETEDRYTRRPSATAAGDEEADSPPRSETPAREETEKPAEAQSSSSSRAASPHRAASPAPSSGWQSRPLNSHGRSGRPQPTINTNVGAIGRSSSISCGSPAPYSPYSSSHSSSRPGTSASFYPPPLPTTPGTPYSRPGTSMSAYSRPGSAASSTRGRDRDEALQQRIERLRAAGWQRKRFDGRRYEALRERVLGELGAPGA